MKLFGIDIGHGNSIKDKLYWLINGFMTDRGYILWGGSSPPPAAPTSTTVNQTNIPCYAQPYVMNMLNSAQAQIYNPSGTGFNPYVPYSNDPTNYVAGASPMQQQAYSASANMNVPGQYGVATGATMGTIGNLSGLGAQMGNAGNQYNAMATNPYATQAFMNPYVQASLAPQLQLANQQYGIAGQQEQSNAAKSGAFGGSREALMNSLNQQNQMLAQNQLISQGYNTAFNNAQQAQQYGANLGLQGQQGQLATMQAQLGGANQLASIGGSCLAAQQGIANQQNQFGAAQQQNQQQVINQAVQNYATAQQYPYMQLGTLNAMLRGLPMNQVSTATYMAPPSGISQLAGLGTAGLGLAKIAGAKKGGVIKAAGGIPMSMYSPQQLQHVEQSPYSTPIAKIVANGYAQDDNRIQANPEAPKMLSQAQPQMPPQDRNGIGAIATPPDLTTMRAAGGGLLAFAGKDESLVPSDDAANFKLASDTEENKPSSSSSTPFTIFGHPMNQAARDAEVPKVNALNWKDQIKPQDAPQDSGPNMSAFNQYVRDNQQDNVPSAPVVTPQTILANFKKSPAPVASDKPIIVAKNDVPAQSGETTMSDYDEIKHMLMDEYKNPSTKTSDEIKAQLSSVQKRMEERDKRASGEALTRAGFAMMSGTSPYALVNIGKGAPEGLDYYNKQLEATAEDQNLIDKYSIAGQSADEARHQQVGINLLKMGEMDQAAKDRLTAQMTALKNTQEYRQANQETKNLLAASLIQNRNYKEDTVKGEKSSQIGGAISMFDNTLRQIDKIQNHPGRYNGANALGAAESYIPSTDAYDYKAALQGLKDTQFMASIAGIKGTGIGKILLPEVQKIQNSTGVLDTHQSRAQFDQQLNNLRDMLTAAKSRAIGSANQYGISPQDLGIVQ